MKTAEEILQEVLSQNNYFSTDPYEVFEAMKKISLVAMSKYAEQRLLLSSEAEKGEKVNDEMLKALRGVVELRQLIEYPSTVSEEHEGEASAIYNMMMKIEAAIKLAEIPSPPSPQEKQGVEAFSEQQVRKAIAYFDLSKVHPASILHEQTIRERTDAAIKHIRKFPAPAAPDKGEDGKYDFVLPESGKDCYHEETPDGHCFKFDVPGYGTVMATHRIRPVALKLLYKKLEELKSHPSVEKSEGEEAALASEPVVVERFADNGEHSHWDLVDRDTGQTIWSEDPDFPRELLKYASDRNNSSGDRGRKEEK